ncbi:MAG: tRNA uridine-5-carboxymethylaminomethyl(34) synthesis GTPase MnmE, partial [Candidatus Eisenbacteria bacterium]
FTLIARPDTIAALATPPGISALAVVRLSGPAAVEIADCVFQGRRTLGDLPARTLAYGRAADGAGEMLDEVTAVVLRAPASATGEDVVEITCHGGTRSAPRLLAALLAAGARNARAGEFTERAFLSGRIDLAQAEAVADVIHAETDLAHRLAARQIAGGLSRGLSAVAESLRDALAEIEARVDFAEDVGGVIVPAPVAAALTAAEAALDRLLTGADLGRRAREGARVVLAGRPNAGKSSLFNALLGEDRALVTAEPGTTRDALAERLDLEGMPVRLLDTAGLREAISIEALGVERARRELATADLVLWVIDGSRPRSAEDRAADLLVAGQPHVIARSKADLPVAAAPTDLAGEAVAVSAVTGEGLPALRAALARALRDGRPSGAAAEALVTNGRHIDALRRAREAIAAARVGAAADTPGELVAGDVRAALDALGEVTGEAAAPDLLERIFARFCIGK